MEKKEIEKSIIKKYRKEIWRKFTKAVTDYQLISDGDKIAVCISGGKDSFLLAKCLEEIKRHGKIKFDLEFICMDPGYDLKYKETNALNAEKLGIKLNIFSTNVFEVSKKLNEKSPCYLCARMRRGYLYDYAKSLGCNKIALGHHFDDIIETTLLNIFYNGKYETMLPKVQSDNFERMQLIRPLAYVKEKDIISWSKYINVNFIGCACGFKKENSKREYIKDLIKKLKIDNEFIDKNIFKSAQNVNLSQIQGYYKDEKRHNFLENFK